MVKTDIYSLIDGILSTVTIDSTAVPYYYGLPAYGSEEPENFIVYEMVDTPVDFSCNTYSHVEWTVTVNIYTSSLNSALINSIISKFTAAGFIYQGGAPIEADDNDDKNLKRQKQIKEFKIILED